MSPDIADKKFTVAIRTAYGAAVALALGAAGLSVAAYRLTEAVNNLQSDHWGLIHQVRFAQIAATWNPMDPVPDPLDIYQGKASVSPIAVTPSRTAHSDGRN